MASKEKKSKKNPAFDKESQEARFCQEWNHKFLESMVTKAEYTKKWKEYQDAYSGDYFKDISLPSYRSDVVSNYIFSNIETIRPIMFDSNPRFQALPRRKEGVEKAMKAQRIMDYEFDRAKLQKKIIRESINMLVLGNMIFYVPWSVDKDNVDPIPVSPFNIFPDALATSFDDAEFVFYATYKHENIIKKSFPDIAKDITGGSVNHSELVHDNDKAGTGITNQILVLECYAKDWTTMDIETDGQGNRTSKMRYPNGRHFAFLPQFNKVLFDKKNPYKDKKHPFVLIKDYDIPGKFWGEGEVAQLLSPQKAMNDLNNQIIDNARQTANMPWIMTKNTGIKPGTITNRPGLIIPINPGSELRREQPPTMPSYVSNKVLELKEDMEQISGVFDTLKGNSEKGVYTAQGVLALQEAGQARIRLKTKLMEEGIGEMSTMYWSRIKQYWTSERMIAISGSSDELQTEDVTPKDVDEEYDFKVIAGSTMAQNKGAMLDLMLRLAQTTGEDGLPLVDRETIMFYLPFPEKQDTLKRMKEKAKEQSVTNEHIQENDQEHEEMSNILQEVTKMVQEISTEMNKVGQEIDRLNQENENQAQEEKLDTAREKSYNEGYKDAEGVLSPSDGGVTEENTQDGVSSVLPDDILDDIETMSDAELMELANKYPEFKEMIDAEIALNQQNPTQQL